MHPGSTKMYHDLKPLYWWTRMKREIAKYVSECDICQRIKASHLKSTGALQPLSIPSWKWDDISMDFIVGLPNTSWHHDSIWVIMDWLTKVAHFLQVHTTNKARKYRPNFVFAWITPDHCLWPRSPIHSQILGTIARVLGNQANKKFSLPSSNWLWRNLPRY